MTITAPVLLTTTRANTATLVAAVKDALRAVAKRPSVPVLAHLRLHANGDTITVTGYNYDLSITRMVRGAGNLPPVLVPGIPLRDALARLDQKQDVSISVDGTKVTLKQGTRSVTLNTAPIEDFPPLPNRENARCLFETTGTTLDTLAKGVSPFVSKDDMLPVLTATHLRLETNTLHAETTDRFRLAHIHRPVAGMLGEEHFEAMLPNLPAIAAVMASSVGIIVQHETYSPGDAGTIFFASDEAIVTQRLLDGEFPKVQRLFPTEPNTLTTFEPVKFLSALKFVEAGVERNCAVSLTADETGTIVLSTTNEDNQHQDTVAATVIGEPLTTGFNPAYLADAVKVFGKGHDVLMSSTVGTKPSVFESESVPDLRVLLMPRRLIS